MSVKIALVFTSSFNYPVVLMDIFCLIYLFLWIKHRNFGV